VSEPSDKSPGRLERSQIWLGGVSSGLADRSADLAVESDRWFLSAVRFIGHGAERAHGGVESLAHAALARTSRWWPRFARRTPRERLSAMIRKEAQRLDVDTSRQDIAEFSDKMAALLELVLSGVLSVNDVAFDAADLDASVESAEEVTDQHEHDQRDQGDPLCEKE
jgi:hypothetical protein